MFHLRDYQQDLINNIRQKIREKHKTICAQAPTGSGKTVVFSYIVKNALAKNNKVLILTDRIELLTETGGTLSGFNIPFSTIEAGQKYPKSASCIVAMAQTLKRRINDKNFPNAWKKFFASFDLVIIDENHKQEFNDFFTHEVFKNAIVLGFSATPERSGKARQLAEDYSALVHGPTTQELIDKGYLVPDRYFYAKGIETKGLKKNSRGDDYAESDQFARFNRPELYGDAVKVWKEKAPDTITLVFTVNIQHAVETCKAYNNEGISAKFLTSDVARPKLPENPTPAQKSRYDKHKAEYDNWAEAYKKYSGPRNTVLAGWKAGHFKVLVNASILTTGFNFPAIDTIQILRVTISTPLWLQMLGRGSRPAPGKEYFNIIDHGNHGQRLGMYRDPRKFSLIHKQSKGGAAAPVKECGAKKRKGVKQDPLTGYYPDKDGRPGCGSYINASTMICPFCGYKYDTDKEIVEAEFEEYKYDIEPAQNIKMKEPDEIDEIIRKQESRGYKEGWAVRQIAYRLGIDGLKKYGERRNRKKSWAYVQAKRLKIA